MCSAQNKVLLFSIYQFIKLKTNSPQIVTNVTFHTEMNMGLYFLL